MQMVINTNDQPMTIRITEEFRCTIEYSKEHGQAPRYMQSSRILLNGLP